MNAIGIFFNVIVHTARKNTIARLQVKITLFTIVPYFKTASL